MEKHLSLPLSEGDVRSLNTGDIVYLSGEVIQLLGPAHRRALEYKAENRELPFEIENMAIYHCYTCLTGDKDHLQCEFLGASTSAGVNPYEPEFIRQFKVRAVIGKGGMDDNTLQAMKEVGCVYLAQIGGCCQLSSQAVQETKGTFWEDMAANFGVKMIFKDLGPLVVAMDANGHSQFETINQSAMRNKKNIMRRIDME